MSGSNESSGVPAFPPVNFSLEAARGEVPGVRTINKSGISTNVDSGVDTDVWDRANPTNDQDIWVAPTTARIHDIVSTSTDDDGEPAGVGARTMRVTGLTDWDAADETSEDITLDGTTNVPTVNAYVIIYRMRVLTWGATNINVGTITATAQTDATVTAQINVGLGQTQMAIYAVPSTQTLFLSSLRANLVDTNTGAEVLFKLLVNTAPNLELTNFTTKIHGTLKASGTSGGGPVFNPPKIIAGPAIIKMQANGDAINMTVAAAFDGFICDN